MKLITIVLPALALVNAGPLQKRADGETETWCSWGRPQSALVRNKIWIDGGAPTRYLTAAGGIPKPDTVPRQEVYYIELNRNFTIGNNPNFTQVIKSSPKPSRNMGPNVENGHLLSNDYEFLLYGGLMVDTDSQELPSDTWALARDLFEHKPVPLSEPDSWRAIQTMDGDVTRGIAAGAYVSVPSENLAFVLGGSRNKDWNEVRTLARPANRAGELSNQLISADLSTMGSEKFRNTTIDSADVAPRTAGEIVWVPMGKKGALVALGGSVMPYNDTASTGTKISTADNSDFEDEGAKFMSEVNVYDVDKAAWFTQPTSGDIPPATAEFCTAVASTTDGNTHNIYAYGGFSGVARAGYSGQSATGNGFAVPVYDTVYVLSLPGFVWTKAYEGETANARRGHRCHRVADNQLMVVGGVGAGGDCVPEFVRVFDMNTNKFASSYDPTVNAKYDPPSAIASASKPDKWADGDLEALMADRYPGTVKNYWPFPKLTETSRSDGSDSTSSTTTNTTSNGLPNYVPPLLGAILGLLVIITILCGVLFWLRRRKRNMRRLQSDSAASTVVKKRQTWSWLMGTYGDEKPDVGFLDDDHTHRGDFEGSTAVGGSTPAYERADPMQISEADASGQIYELPDNHGRSELPAPGGIMGMGRRESAKRVTIDDRPQEMGQVPQSPTSPTEPVRRELVDADVQPRRVPEGPEDIVSPMSPRA
ncbi:hypothetical protein EDC01DRAFT_678300 [Geopyxis carbonaria]|nr:hypothetical protein EDC01DRAFT_678300 [Geopyxis carbonaria]